MCRAMDFAACTEQATSTAAGSGALPIVFKIAIDHGRVAGSGTRVPAQVMSAPIDHK